MNDLPNNGFAYDIKHIAEHLYHDSRCKGERNDAALALMGAAMVFIGGTIFLGAIQRIKNTQLGSHARGR